MILSVPTKVIWHMWLQLRCMEEVNLFCSQGVAQMENYGFAATFFSRQGNKKSLDHNSNSMILLVPYKTHI